MSERFEHIQNDEDVEEILKRAIRQETVEGTTLRERLSMAASELGISDEALLRAEAEYRAEKSTENLRAEFVKTRRNNAKSEALGLLTPILIVLAIDFFTFNMLFGGLSWSLLVSGILLAVMIGKLIPVIFNPEGTEEDFEKWARRRERKARRGGRD